ncbi:MAG: hypothetical protein JSS95_08970 [Acidobacteria bacterium]|nr:hypothetical protein [Acidobacteriota bacterium]
MTLRVLQPGSCANACANCPRTAALRRKACDPHAACPGYGTSASCPPLIVLAVHECFNAALSLSQPGPTDLRTIHA